MAIINLFATLVVTGITFVLALAAIFAFFAAINWLCGIYLKITGQD